MVEKPSDKNPEAGSGSKDDPDSELQQTRRHSAKADDRIDADDDA